MSKRSYITATGLATIAASLSALDRRIISDVDRLDIASGNQLRRLHYPDSDAGRRLCRLHLAQLVETRVLARLTRRIGGERSGSEGFLYVLDVAGQRLVDPDQQRWWRRTTPGVPFLRHALAVSDLYVGLRERETLGVLALRRFDTEPMCWRRFPGPGGGLVPLKPDAYAVVEIAGYEDHYFVELDRATESTNRIAEKARVYARYFQSGTEQRRIGVFPQVLFVVPDDVRAAQIVGVLGRLDPDIWNLFAITTFKRGADYMAAERDGSVDEGRA